MEFRHVKGYEGLYVVTSTGLVIGLKSNKVLKVTTTYNGYLRVKLYKNAVEKMYMVHRIVADAFYPHNDEKNQVNHIDGNKTNNTVENLEWVTQSENQIHAQKHGLNTTKYAVEANKKKVIQKSLDGDVVNVWESLSEAGRNLGLQVSNISNCCKGRIKQTGGYKWSLG